MGRHVRICPICGRPNDETAMACENDSEYLGDVGAVWLEDSPPAQAPAAAPAPTPAPAPAPAHVPLSDPALQAALQEACSYLKLHLPAMNLDFDVADGHTIGQAAPGSLAEIQLPPMQDISLVHRRHCRFVYRDRNWHIIPLENPEYTNPTFVNQNRVYPENLSPPLRDGDRIILARTTLIVRIFGA
jgi:hypothetical protein